MSDIIPSNDFSLFSGWKPNCYHHCFVFNEGFQPCSGDMPVGHSWCGGSGGVNQPAGHRGSQMQGTHAPKTAEKWTLENILGILKIHCIC